MSQQHAIRSYDYVNQPYDKVRDALREHAKEVFSRATQSAGQRAEALVTSLHVKLAGVELGKDVAIEIHGVTDETGPMGEAVTRVALSWRAMKHAAIFPAMEGDLDAYKLSSEETQLDFRGRYKTPLGTVGDAVDSLVGHRVAEASVQRFVQDVARFLREALTAS
jgi:hypothetical protein